MKLGITSIQRNRAPWIKEWVAFHHLAGFNKFYIYLHKCTDDTEKIIRNLQKSFDIKMINVEPFRLSPQVPVYQESYSKFGKEVDWMAFIDSDEFLFPTSTKTMQDALKEFDGKKISALGFYWSIFGSSGHKKEPEGLIIENFKYKAANGYPNNRHIKSIIKGGQKGIIAVDPHFFETPLGTFDEILRPVTTGFTEYEPSYEKFRINHYITQSREYYLNFKKHAGTSADNISTYARPRGWWQEHDKNDIKDSSLDRFISPLKKLLKEI